VIAADSSSLIAYLSGAQGEDVEILDPPPVVLVEFLSDWTVPSSVFDLPPNQ
jgi:hypothetical protein